MTLEKIRAIGFDLDQTLYPKSQEIDEAIQNYIFKEIADHKKCSTKEARTLFLSHYTSKSGREALCEIGIPKTKASEIIQQALEAADLSKYLKPDERVKRLLKALRSNYSLALITGSHKDNAEKKLRLLEIPSDTFDIKIYGNVSKRDGSAFKKWMSTRPELEAEQFLYVGDRVSTDIEPAIRLGIKAILVGSEETICPQVPRISSIIQLSRELDISRISRNL
ncbi:HAD family hydrolase [Candidatus Woesearchaeota archaeon]|nr:MAG: HAD family hydrolase [Candidatus Woesearchaeota archaeon]